MAHNKYCGGVRLRKEGGWRWQARLIVAAITFAFANSQDISACCSKAEGTCRSVCEKMSLVEISSDSTMREERIQHIYKFCAPQSIEFWICMNHTIQEIVTGMGWWGRGCCVIGHSTSCRHACATAKDASPLRAACRQSDEIALFDCVQSQEQAQSCCSQADSLSCYEACQKVLWRVGQARVELGARERAMEACERSPALLRCLQNMTVSTVQVDTSKYLPCCKGVSNVKCKTACEDVLSRTGDINEITEALFQSCGMPTLHKDMWQCFLQKDAPPDTKDLLPHAANKLHCCRKATTIHCRNLCFNAFNFDVGWEHWKKFDSECLGEPLEVELSECLEEIEYPCSLGCSGLTYCSHLNNHHTSLFRFCSTVADLNSHLEVAEQRANGVVTVSGYRLHLKKNSSQLTTDMWKTVTCALNVKPCTPKGQSSRVCMADCVRLVAGSVEWRHAPAQLSAHALCARLAPRAPSAPCVPLRHYAAPGTEIALMSPQEAVTSPCGGQVCGASELCVINRNCIHGDHCKRYACEPGCRLGDRTSTVVPIGSHVRVPMVGSGNTGEEGSGAQKACFKVCRCTTKGLRHCQPLPCLSLDNCRLHDKIVPHGDKYYMECNQCVCTMGERVCARRACGGTRAVRPRLPCGCPPHHLPVHAPGRTFPNLCLARCAGATDAVIEFAPRPPCSGPDAGACGRRHACLPARNVCLSRLQTSCPQHVCVNITDCSSQPSTPVCDMDGKTHDNPCHLVMSGSKFAYWGPCLNRCSKASVVCGVNGITYTSECAAWAEYVTVDYMGPCLAVGPISDFMEPKCTIDRITCLPLKNPKCLGFTAPGACCPKCGGALRILYSKKQIDRALYGTNISATAINLNKILKALERHVTIAECALRGYLTIEMEIFVTIESLLDNPTDLQLSVCVLEAEKLADLINRESALMSTDLGLSALTYALTVHTYSNMGVNGASVSFVVTVVSYFTVYILR
ncbi:reversion-inducing cysteine-rich protein with Kazal motifs [Achroia grisella]|uniref:reversion-inducing cysteine-rich protein with Kazal motifs n=1 Tax=Achroia grisella TaxID=688607 RepID=UPI0027D339BA|nr:reversion-inducing cysteine-rich protein with Kazal motifs [Achroia grisella]